VFWPRLWLTRSITISHAAGQFDHGRLAQQHRAGSFQLRDDRGVIVKRWSE